MARIYDNLETRFSEGLQGIISNVGVKRVDFCVGYAKFMAIKCLGKDDEAKTAAFAFLNEFGKRELEMEHY